MSYSGAELQQPAPALAGPPATEARVRSGCALRLIWATFIFFVVGVGVGISWDQTWHTMYEFDTFFAPPHILTYSVVFITTAIVALITYAPALRPAFGPGFRVVGSPVPIPGALALLGSGFITLALAGFLDFLWHSNFGLDETGWSTPHAMIGWGLLVVVLGFVACRLALRRYRPLGRLAPLVLSFLVLGFSFTPIVGPIGANTTPETVRAISNIPALAAQPPAQHTFRIYLEWNLTRTHPLLAPLGALWAGGALALLRGLDPRPRIWLTTAALWSVAGFLSELNTVRELDQYFRLNLEKEAANWLPLPLLPAAVAVAVMPRLQLGERWTWLVAGAVFGVLAALIWGPQPQIAVLVVLSTLAMLLGARLGTWTYRALERPVRADVLRLIAAGIGVPFLVGMVDLYLRRVTP